MGRDAFHKYKEDFCSINHSKRKTEKKKISWLLKFLLIYIQRFLDQYTKRLSSVPGTKADGIMQWRHPWLHCAALLRQLVRLFRKDYSGKRSLFFPRSHHEVFLPQHSQGIFLVAVIWWNRPGYYVQRRGKTPMFNGLTCLFIGLRVSHGDWTWRSGIMHNIPRQHLCASTLHLSLWKCVGRKLHILKCVSSKAQATGVVNPGPEFRKKRKHHLSKELRSCCKRVYSILARHIT